MHDTETTHDTDTTHGTEISYGSGTAYGSEAFTAELTRAAAHVTPAFADLPDRPLTVRGASELSGTAGEELARQYDAHGFAIVEFTDERVTEDTHLLACKALGLGEPFVPKLYTLGNRVAPPVSVISASVNAGTEAGNHPSFGRSVGQELHVDGTLQPMGMIKATLMSCQTPAVQGGVNTFFDSVGAYAELLRTDLPAALTLANPRVLVRRANINGSDEAKTGPVYAVIEDRLVGHYCLTDTDSFQTVDDVSPEDFARGLAALAEAARPGSPYCRTVTLRENQAVIFDNTRLSHGRTAYEDSSGNRRCLFRTLHVRHPQPESAS
ncbi:MULTISPECIES: TauD/TfdA family dioxygenase [unclassified Streptomyces]|uniref:TauD/TfdA family dioxygenase n=1 Tax=unclassified Streptomyces TaxID=2593676 RepID=UPI001BEB48BD|nr:MULTISPECIES: TauD/TfdA family dioxygenase [unclassified Streptomyces]MBT2408162.1 TauD/TfdA family dioxygenase [Streptomyces sp. ISL-21]MBT2456059.1 TauD/TfdA family dioxygenase [Streptomyces sp. ISL-86]MBT2609280.1 TauD/TfdA family dioxygenase [Streptomyces sp. ISL-87]